MRSGTSGSPGTPRPARSIGAGYDASEVNDLLDRVAAELDAGRPIGPLIANAAFRARSLRGFYDIGAVDWFLEQLRRREDPAEMARMNADPWPDPAADAYCIRREPGELAGRVAMVSPQEYADAWRDFGQQPGTRLSFVRVGRRRYELRTADQLTVAAVRYGSQFSAAPVTTLSAGGRTFTWKRIGQSSWPGIAETISRDRPLGPGTPAHMLKRQTDELKRQTDKRDPLLRQLLDETGTPILYTGGAHFDHIAGTYIKFPGQRWLRFPVRGTTRADAIMTAVDQAGNKVARYRLALDETRRRDIVEVTVHPGQQLTDELTLVIALSVDWLRSYFRSSSGGG
jgi:DivIVA domain-containing protein